VNRVCILCNRERDGEQLADLFGDCNLDEPWRVADFGGIEDFVGFGSVCSGCFVILDFDDMGYNCLVVLAGSPVRLNVRVVSVYPFANVLSGDLARDVTTFGERVTTVLVSRYLPLVMVSLGDRTIADEVGF